MSESAIRRLTAPLRRRLKLLVSRAVGRLVDPSTLLQTVQLELLRGELLDGVEHVEGYGRTAVPPAGWEGIAASLGGDRSHTVLLSAFHRQFRVRNLAEGEVALYTDEGDVIHFKRGQHIYIDAGAKVTVRAPNVDVLASVKVFIDTPEAEVTGNLTVGGNADIAGDTSVGGNTAITGNTTVGGTAAVAGIATLGGLAVTGVASGGGASTVTGSLTISQGDVTADGISLKGHTHTDSQGGSTSAPDTE